MCLRTEQDYLDAVRSAELKYGRDHLQTGDALVALAKFYERAGLIKKRDVCDARIREILEKFLGDE